MSIRHITGKPIKFLGVGEKTDALEPFHPDRVASRILGMGDVLTLVEEAQRNIDQAKVVIPELRISDLGLVDVTKFEKTDVIIEAK